MVIKLHNLVLKLENETCKLVTSEDAYLVLLVTKELGKSLGLNILLKPIRTQYDDILMHQLKVSSLE